MFVLPFNTCLGALLILVGIKNTDMIFKYLIKATDVNKKMRDRVMPVLSPI